MSLPTISGRGFLISDGVELKFGKSGTPYARLPLVFKNRHRNGDGEWTHDKEVLVEGTVFGRLAEELADVVTTRTDINVIGDLYSEEYEGKKYLKMLVHAAWPAKEDNAPRAPVSVGAASDDDDDIPF